MRKLKLIAFASIALYTIVSCGRYDEGSNFSLISAKNRVVNKWTLNKLEVNNVTAPSVGGGLTVEFRKDNTFTRTITFFGVVSANGTWILSGDKKNILMTLTDGSILTYKIIQLKNKSLKVEEVQGNDTIRFTFIGD
jgi:hypothetical protein